MLEVYGVSAGSSWEISSLLLSSRAGA